MRRKFRIVFVLAIIFFSLLYSTKLSDVFNEKSVAKVEDIINKDKDKKESAEDKKDKKDKKEKNEILFLLMGVDAEDVKKSKGARTDTLMLIKINFENGDTKLLSIPRDTRVAIKGKMDKINHAHHYGGTELAMDTVRDFLNIDLDYYVKVDYKIVQDVVNAIGGVKIDVPFDMKYKEYNPSVPPLDINIKKGEQVLNGKNAHDFLRWRNNNDMTVAYKDGDIGRIKAQQYFMKELVKQTLKAKNLLKLPKLAEAYFENVDTNIPLNLVLKGVASAKKIDVENMTTTTLPGAGEYVGKISYFLHNKEKTKALMEEMFDGYIK